MGLVDYFDQQPEPILLLCVKIHIMKLEQWPQVLFDDLIQARNHVNNIAFEVFASYGQLPVINTNHTCKHNLWYVDSYEAFNFLVPRVNDQGDGNMGEYIVALKTYKDLKMFDELHNIFQLAYSNNIINIVVVYIISWHLASLYTYEIYNPGHCGELQLVRCNEFERGRFQKSQIMSVKLQNFNNCTLNILVRKAAPFFMYKPSPDQTGIMHYEGLEGEILRAYSTKYNIHLNFTFDPNKAVGHVFRNGTFTGPFHLLANYQIDIVVGFYLSPISNAYFSSTVPHSVTPLLTVIRRHRNMIFANRWPLNPFHWSIWLLSIIAVALSVILWGWVKKCFPRLTHSRWMWLDWWGLALGNSRSFDLLFSPIFLGVLHLWIFSFTLLQFLYQARLYETFNQEMTFNYKSVQELIKDNFTFYIRDALDAELYQELKIPPQQSIIVTSTGDEYYIYEKMLNDKPDRNVATFTIHWNFQYYLKKYPKAVGQLIALPVHVNAFPTCTYMRKNFYLLKHLNALIANLRSGGITRIWVKNLPNFSSREKRNLHHIPQVLKLEDFLFILGGLLIMHTIAIVTFLTELLKRSSQRT